MAGTPGDGLSRRERQIMDVIYARGSSTALEVLQGLPDPPTKTAVRTLLQILEKKGYLKHTQQGREYVYQPTRPRLRAGRSALQRVLRTFFNGSLEKAVAAYLGDSSARLSAEELQRVTEMLQEARCRELETTTEIRSRNVRRSSPTTPPETRTDDTNSSQKGP